MIRQIGAATLHLADCADVLPGLPESSVDAVVTDPPYGLRFMGKRWDYDVPSVEIWREVLRVLKPGGHLLSFGGSRTYHRMAVNIEDAGFEIRDCIMWLYGSGFPKSLNIGDGFGTALKPAHEPIVLARKPLAGTVAANVQEWGTGAINVDGCRVGIMTEKEIARSGASTSGMFQRGSVDWKRSGREPAGRWPANVIHDGSEEVLRAFPDAPGQIAKASTSDTPRDGQNTYGKMNRGSNGQDPRDDTGSAARFFYCAKASKADREEGCERLPHRTAGEATGGRQEGSDGLNSPRAGAGRTNGSRNHHPTVKPTDLMRYLCRLVTPPIGVVLDPFMGSGSTGKAALLEGFGFIGIERDPDSAPIAGARIEFARRLREEETQQQELQL